jgi:L,D-peptidoglycan transpeptidase YkuD (ErfK/YbiS/YcfS/YnhG family)
MLAAARKPSPFLCCVPHLRSSRDSPPRMPILPLIRVRRSPGQRSRGLVLAGGQVIPCALGRSGVTRRKREGDGASPAAVLRPLQLFYRADRLRRPRTDLPVRRLRPLDGWCDDPAHSSYNRPVLLPFSASHEQMWREDRLYDLIVDLDWNRRPARRGHGSAIFMHVARPGLLPTEGCIALPAPALLRLLARIGPATRIALA